jgi:hypothetical protein
MTQLDESAAYWAQVERPKRYFTLAEANRALVLVRRIIADVIVEYSRLAEMHEASEAAEASEASEATEFLVTAQEEMARAAVSLKTCLEELDDVGAYVTDWTTGTVEFPCVAVGREVCLCWQYGQPSIRHWRELHGATDAPRPIKALLAEMGAAAPIR